MEDVHKTVMHHWVNLLEIEIRKHLTNYSLPLYNVQEIRQLQITAQYTK